MSTLKPFEEQGHYTNIHDMIFDDIMPICPSSAWKVLCFVLRQTRGWQKEDDHLSYTQIRKGTGLKSDSTISQALKWLTGKGEGNNKGFKLLIAESGKDEWGRQLTTLYRLNRSFELEKPSTETRDGPTTETVDGPTTETVETITTEQQPINNQVVGNNVTYLDSTTSECLLLLKDVKGFPRDEATNAERLAEYRKDFPGADATEVVRDYAAYCKEKPIKSNSKPRLRLRNFFKQAAKGRATDNWTTGSASPEPVVQALARYNNDGRDDLQKFAPLARKWDFTSDENPPWQILGELSRDRTEQGNYLMRIRSVAIGAMREAG